MVGREGKKTESVSFSTEEKQLKRQRVKEVGKKSLITWPLGLLTITYHCEVVGETKEYP